MLIAESGRVHLHGVVTMLIAESGRVHLHGVVTRDVVHVNSGVREGSPPRRSYEGCGSC